MNKLEILEIKLILYEIRIKSYLEKYLSLNHTEKMQSSLIFTINDLSKRIKNIQININQEKQKL